MTTQSPLDLTLKKRLGLPEELAAIIIRRVAMGDFKLGEVLPSEQTLAGIYQVSRTVVREALARLKYEGIIMSKRGSGPVICSTTRAKGLFIEESAEGCASLSSFYEVRLLLEGEAAALAAFRHTESQAHDLLRFLTEMGEAIKAKSPGADPDYRFHGLIAEAADNEYLSIFSQYLSTKTWMRVYSARSRSNLIRKQTKAVFDEHKAIYEAVISREAYAARRAAQVHILGSAARQNIDLPARHLSWQTGDCPSE